MKFNNLEPHGLYRNRNNASISKTFSVNASQLQEIPHLAGLGRISRDCRKKTLVYKAGIILPLRRREMAKVSDFYWVTTFYTHLIILCFVDFEKGINYFKQNQLST